MIDLTPLDVRKKRGDFRRILRGYDPEEVDSFLELVGERLEELVKNNLVLSERAERLERSLTALEQRESAVQEALVTAQELRREVHDQSHRDAEILKGQALREAQLLRAEAEAEIAKRLGEVDGLIRERRRALEDMERNRRKFLKSFRGLLEREMDTVEVEEARAPLDEGPLELEFRGWIPAGGMEPGEGGGDDVSLPTPGGFDTQVLPARGEVDSLSPADDRAQEVAEEESKGFEGDGASAVEEPQPESLEPDVHAGPRTAAEEEAGPDPDLGRSASGGQPEWLFSLLKRDNPGGRNQDA